MPTILLGGYSAETCFQFTTHRYVGFDSEGPSGYVILLEIHDPPPNTHPIVIFRWDEQEGGLLTEFETVAQAMDAFERFLVNRQILTRKYCFDLPGSRGCVFLKEQVPWFYATDRSIIRNRVALLKQKSTD